MVTKKHMYVGKVLTTARNINGHRGRGRDAKVSLSAKIAPHDHFWLRDRCERGSDHLRYRLAKLDPYDRRANLASYRRVHADDANFADNARFAVVGTFGRQQPLKYVLGKACHFFRCYVCPSFSYHAVGVYEQRQVPIWQKQKLFLFGFGSVDCLPRIDKLLMSLHAWRKTRRAGKSDRYFDFIRLQLCTHVKVSSFKT